MTQRMSFHDVAPDFTQAMRGLEKAIAPTVAMSVEVSLLTLAALPVVAVTAGIRKLLSEDELRGVLAHELGHVRNRDILLTSVASAIGTAIFGFV